MRLKRTYNVLTLKNYNVKILIMIVFFSSFPAAFYTASAQDTPDLISYYRGLGSDPNGMETRDLLKAADNWSFEDVPPGFLDPISTRQLNEATDEWISGLKTSTPNITSFSPQSSTSNIEGGIQIFNITVDQHVNITWYINGTEVLNESHSTRSFYINNSAAPGTWIVNATASNKNGAVSHEWIWAVRGPPEPTSFDLIDGALANGTIDNETALIYKVYVAFSDKRLPAQYLGNDNINFSTTSLMAVVASRFNNLTPEAQNILYPFFIPAHINGSWHYLRNHPEVLSSGSNNLASYSADRISTNTFMTAIVPPGGPNIFEWDYMDTDDPANVRIWYQKRYIDNGDRSNALFIKYAIETTIRPKLFDLMKKDPPSDSDIKLGLNGGDGRLDISLVDFDSNNPYSIRAGGDAGNAVPFYTVLRQDCKAPTPVFIQINRNVLSDPKQALATTTHEYMHAILNAFSLKTGCMDPEYSWLNEATATWSIDYVDVIGNPEHDYAEYFLNVPEQSLESRGDINDLHPYGAYLFPFYLARILGQPGLIKTIWDKAENYDSLESIDLAIPGGFQMQWPEFVKYNWNKEKFDQYQTKDPDPPLTKGAVTVGTPRGSANNRVEEVRLNGLPEIEFTMNANVGHLAAHYYDFVFTDPNVRSVAYYNPFYSLDPSSFDPAVKVTALVKIDGHEWTEEDWTYIPGTSFCLDKKDERLTELVIIFSNIDWHDHILQPATNPRLMANNIGCWRWKGSATDIMNIHDVLETGSSRAITENILLETIRDSSQRKSFFTFYDSYRLLGGATMLSSYSSTIGKCSRGFLKFQFLPSDSQQGFTVNNYVLDGPNPVIFGLAPMGSERRHYVGSGFYSYLVDMTTRCPDGSGTNAIPYGSSWLVANDMNNRLRVENGGNIKGEVFNSNSNGDQRITWKFEPLRQR